MYDADENVKRKTRRKHHWNDQEISEKTKFQKMLEEAEQQNFWNSEETVMSIIQGKTTEISMNRK